MPNESLLLKHYQVSGVTMVVRMQILATTEFMGTATIPAHH